VNAKSETEQATSLVVGGTWLVGGYIVEHLLRGGARPLALSRAQQGKPGVDWFRGNLQKPDTPTFPAFTTLYCTADAVLLADALPRLFGPSLRRVVAFSSTSVITKQDTKVAAERETIRKLADAERRIAAACEQHNVGWTMLRPTLIYAECRDTNISPLSRLIRRFGFMPLVGGAPGLRQPVHAEDLAIGAIAAAGSAAAVNKVYALPGGETLAYREMIGRIFDGMRLPRRTISVPPLLMESRLHAGESAFSGRERRDGHSHDERHDFRFHAQFGTSAGKRGPSIPCSTSVANRFAGQGQLHQSMNTTVLRPLRITRSSRW
jgi:nucleoside-diphosphate-sugar epimerase